MPGTACIIMLLLGLVLETPIDFTPREQRRILQHSPVPSVPDDPTNDWDQNPRAALLGQSLFFDAGFSRTNSVSCATCHQPRQAFTDGLPVAQGLAPGSRHTPGLLNVAHQRWFFWDGRADTLWSQALHPIEEPTEFGSSRVDFLRRIHSDDAYRAAYEDLFGSLPPMDDTERFPPGSHGSSDEWKMMDQADRDAVNRAMTNLAKSVAAYESRLRSAKSPFDMFVEGLRDSDPGGMAAISPSAQRGLKLFIGEAGCRQCHSGPLFTDFEFHNIGLPPREGIEGLPPSDPGRFDGIHLVQDSELSAHGPFSDDPGGDKARRTRSTKRSQEHWGAFKTPSLRNLTRTAPYMHQGHFETLEEVLDYYNTLEDMVLQDHHQEAVLKPLDLDQEELDDLLAFLRSLESPLPDEALLKAPTSPLLPDQQPPTGPGEGAEQ